MKRHILQPSNDCEIRAVFFGERMKILEQIDRRFDVLQHRIERGKRIGGGSRAGFGPLRFRTMTDDSLCAGPDIKLLVPRRRNIRQQFFDPLFLPTHDINDRVFTTPSNSSNTSGVP